MKRRINDIFCSIQGEGHNTGRAAVFVRFAGCNLKCPFCDTDFDDFREMSDMEILAEMERYAPRLAILTGGEPTLQTDSTFVDLLHKHGFEVAMETNGTNIPADNIDWIACSPKGKTAIRRCDELKCVFTCPDDADTHGIEASYYYLQPCDMGDLSLNRQITDNCIEYIKQHPQWRLSLQTHKLADFK